MIYELLAPGSDNARTGKELAALCGCDIRTVTEQIEKERREGQPICANMYGIHAGYYLAANEYELEAYCGKIHKRASELFKTRRALLTVLEEYRNKQIQRQA